jgi:hypothetical protein
MKLWKFLVAALLIALLVLNVINGSWLSWFAFGAILAVFTIGLLEDRRAA